MGCTSSATIGAVDLPVVHGDSPNDLLLDNCCRICNQSLNAFPAAQMQCGVGCRNGGTISNDRMQSSQIKPSTGIVAGNAANIAGRNANECTVPPQVRRPSVCSGRHMPYVKGSGVVKQGFQIYDSPDTHVRPDEFEIHSEWDLWETIRSPGKKMYALLDCGTSLDQRSSANDVDTLKKDSTGKGSVWDTLSEPSTCSESSTWTSSSDSWSSQFS